MVSSNPSGRASERATVAVIVFLSPPVISAPAAVTFVLETSSIKTLAEAVKVISLPSMFTVDETAVTLMVSDAGSGRAI
jgi:hypothetical protein